MKIEKTDPILVIGGGSIGERHIGNLLRLGYSNIVVLRSRMLPFRNLDSTHLTIVTNWNAALTQKPKAAFICTPTSYHISQAILCAENGIHILTEKPLSHTGEGIEVLLAATRKTGVFVQVGYMMRYHPHATKIKSWINNLTFGPLVSFSTHWGEYLPDWHSWEDYRDSYAAKKELGGGAALTLSHDLDLVLWMVSKPVVRHSIIKNYSSSLEVDVDSAADFLFSFENGTTGHVHLNFFQKVARREYRFEFENASVCFNFFENRITVLQKESTQILEAENFERNDLFISQTEDFFQQIEEYSLDQSIKNIEDAARIVAFCLPTEN